MENNKEEIFSETKRMDLSFDLIVASHRSAKEEVLLEEEETNLRRSRRGGEWGKGLGKLWKIMRKKWLIGNELDQLLYRKIELQYPTLYSLLCAGQVNNCAIGWRGIWNHFAGR